MVKIATDIPPDLSREIERIIRDGWFPSEEAVLREALYHFVEGRSFLGDSPRMLHRFAADALNESKPEVGLRFVDRALSLIDVHPVTDFALYQALVELRVQILLILGRHDDALTGLEQAREKLPNSPTIGVWMEKVQKAKKELKIEN